MFLSIALLAPLISLVLAAAHPEVTPAPRSPAHHQDLIKLRALERRAAELQGRQKSGELAFCFGRNSICEQSNDLNDECDPYYASSDSTKWYECLCTNGFVSTREACGWCNDAWGIAQIDAGYAESCSSYSFDIAPIPESVLSIQSSYNSTWTGTLLGTATIGAGGGGSSDDATTTTSDRTSATDSGSSGGGVGGIIGGGGNDEESSTESSAEATGDLITTMTLNGGNAGPTATRTVIGDSLVNGGDDTATSTPTGGSSGSGGSSGAVELKVGAGVIFSALAFGVVGLCLL